MRLIALRFQGLGPYAGGGGGSIDFAALTRSRMFLIDGETGVGKTTILDCVTFALYGGLSAATDGKAKQRIRSKFLDTALTETYVDSSSRSAEPTATYAARRNTRGRMPAWN